MRLFRRLLIVALAAGFAFWWFGFAGPYCVSSTKIELIVGWVVLTALVVAAGISLLVHKLISSKVSIHRIGESE